MTLWPSPLQYNKITAFTAKYKSEVHTHSNRKVMGVSVMRIVLKINCTIIAPYCIISAVEKWLQDIESSLRLCPYILILPQYFHKTFQPICLFMVKDRKMMLISVWMQRMAGIIKCLGPVRKPVGQSRLSASYHAVQHAPWKGKCGNLTRPRFVYTVSVNGLVPMWYQAITWNNADLL